MKRATYRRKLEKQFEEMLTPGIFSLDQIKEKENAGVKILTKIIDHDILCKLFELSDDPSLNF